MPIHHAPQNQPRKDKHPAHGNILSTEDARFFFREHASRGKYLLRLYFLRVGIVPLSDFPDSSVPRTEGKTTMQEHTFEVLRQAARRAAERSYVPYSRRPAGCALWTRSGTLILGARVENASYGLLIDPLQNALSTAFAYGERDVVAVALTEPCTLADLDLCAGWLEEAWIVDPEGVGLLSERTGRSVSVTVALPEAWRELDPFLPAHSDTDGLSLARKAARQAYAPESGFRVGCALQTADGRWLLGCNVEQRNWRHVLCAERNVLSTWISYRGAPVTALYICTAEAAYCPPCGACRQVMAELAPEAEVALAGGVHTSSAALLPLSFHPGLLIGQP
jgi:homotetrameric cytidine deaminase